MEMPTSIVMGQGTSATAALTVKQNIPVRKLDIRLPKRELTNQGVWIRKQM